VSEFQKYIAGQSAGGGGDYPEAVHKGLEQTLQLQWNTEDTARVLFLIGDAPPHAHEVGQTMTALDKLRKLGVAIYPVAASDYNEEIELVMRAGALLSGGQFLFLTDDSGVGNPHAEPRIPFYQVEHLNKLMIRMIASELSGQRLEPNPADILRTVGTRPKSKQQ
jgi:hypothetical protein